MKKGFSHKMNLAIKKLVIGTLVAGFLLLPVSVTFEKKYEDIFGVRMQKNEALANVESMNIAVTNTTSSQASITITVSGPLDSGETLHITLYKENLAALGYSPIEGKDFTASYTTPPDQTISYVYSYNFDPDTTYFLLATNVGASKIIASNTVSFKGDGTNINNDVQSAGNNPNAGNQTTQPKKNSGYGFECGIGVFGYSLTGGSIGGCFAAIFYYVWVLTGSVMHLAGRFLDFFVYYSTNSDSYTGAFVEKGWGVVRDVSNLFFIIALLFVAFKVIMNDSHSNPQKLVGMIIMMALLINFSLFATRVVIDASNILAKIFYNNITSKDENGELVNNANGEKSISVGLVQKFNPQNVISKDTYNTENGIYEFIFVTFILILITGYCAWIFFSVSFLFVARVVSLWLAMIFSPIAFASNTVSFNMGSLGYSKWSSELFRNAMLAPLFIFFLYLIVLFLDAAGSTLTYTGSTDLLDNIMHVIIPFMILVGLLQKAKEFAEEYAGKMGDTINKVGGMVTGAALGATAVAGRATIGRLGNYVAESDWAKQAESRGVLGARTLRNLGKAAGTGSMDIRGIAIAGQSITSADLGRAKTGGWAQTTHEKVAARQKRAEELKVGHGEHLTHDLHTAEEKHQNILRNDVVDTKGNEMGSAQKLDQIKAFTDSNKEKQQEWNNKAKNVDTVDAKKKGEQQEALKKAQEMSEVDEEARSKKRLAIQSAQAMIVTDHQKVKEKIDAENKAKEFANNIIKLREEKDAIKDANVFMSADGQIHEGYIKNTDNGKISKKAVDTIEELAEKATLDAKRAVEDAENAVAAAEAAKNAVSAAAANVQAKTVANAAAQSAYQSNLSDLKLQEAAKAAAEAEAKAKNQFAQAQAKDIDAGNDITTKKVEADNAKVKAKALNKKADEWTKEVGKRRKKVGEESSVSWTSNALENTGSSINKYEDEIIPDAQRAIETENKKRMWDYAEDIEARSKGRRDLGITKISNLINGGQHGAHEAASNIRRGAKLDSHGGGHGGGGPKPRPRRSSSGGGGGDDHGGGGAAHH